MKEVVKGSFTASLLVSPPPSHPKGWGGGDLNTRLDIKYLPYFFRLILLDLKGLFGRTHPQEGSIECPQDLCIKRGTKRKTQLLFSLFYHLHASTHREMLERLVESL